jgi:hypothetical protein
LIARLHAGWIPPGKTYTWIHPNCAPAFKTVAWRMRHKWTQDTTTGEYTIPPAFSHNTCRHMLNHQNNTSKPFNWAMAQIMARAATPKKKHGSIVSYMGKRGRNAVPVILKNPLLAGSTPTDRARVLAGQLASGTHIPEADAIQHAKKMLRPLEEIKKAGALGDPPPALPSHAC